jgi:N-acetylglucosamine-6-phosphate deacetylase
MSAGFALAARRIFDGESWHEDAALVVLGDAVEAIVSRGNVPAEIAVIDAGDMLAPGFVDLQVNGGGGVMLNDHPTVAGIETICRAHAPFGTTALLPTLITDTPGTTAATISAGIEAARRKVPGFAGLHLEGPHLSIARKGAHDPDLIRPMTDADLAALIAARRKLPALLTTVAPESVTPQQVAALAAAGIVVSLGHTDTTCAPRRGQRWRLISSTQ